MNDRDPIRLLVFLIVFLVLVLVVVKLADSI